MSFIPGPIDVSDRSGRALGSVTVSSGTITTTTIPTGDNVIGRVKVTDGTNVVSVTASSALKVDGSAVTQPVSGTVSINAIPTGTNVIGSAKITDGTNTAAVTASSAIKVDGSAATQPVSGTVSVNALPTGSNTIGGVKMVDSGGTNVAAISAAGAVKVDGSAATQPVSGTVGVSSLPSIPAGTNAIGAVQVTDGVNTASVGVGTTKALLASIHDGTNLASVTAVSALKSDNAQSIQQFMDLMLREMRRQSILLSLLVGEEVSDNDLEEVSL